jgi:hypothetical protein
MPSGSTVILVEMHDQHHERRFGWLRGLSIERVRDVFEADPAVRHQSSWIRKRMRAALVGSCSGR